MSDSLYGAGGARGGVNSGGGRRQGLKAVGKYCWGREPKGTGGTSRPHP